MTIPGAFLSPAEAAARLGISAKALRVYEQRGLIAPLRTAAGWRAYGPAELERAAAIAALRRLGLALAEVGRILAAEPRALAAALDDHYEVLQARLRDLSAMTEKVIAMREALADGQVPAAAAVHRLLAPGAAPEIVLALPWPWGGELFELRDLRRLTYITGPLGSGKTRLARALAAVLPGAAFVGLDRAAEAAGRFEGDPALAGRVDRALAELAAAGATPSPDLRALLACLEDEGSGALIVDLVERGLDRATQEALIAWLRRHGPAARRLFLLTRSTAILDLDAVGPDEAVLYCPANHSPPVQVAPRPGLPGYEALASCLASPEVRSRTEGVVAVALVGSGRRAALDGVQTAG